MEFSKQDAFFMASALRLAEHDRFLARPNPRVGCIVVKNNRIIGEGFHAKFGDAHAEVNALKSLSTEESSGATVYVTLEPCSHFGKTGPCADALISAKVSRVVCAMKDPNPKVSGQGIQKLEAAGISVQFGLMQQQAERLNLGFIQKMTANRPFVTLKLAMSLDGRTAMASGESQWITGEMARKDVQLLRAKQDAIITGTGTLIHDNPKLNVRLNLLSDLTEFENDHFKQPTRILVDRRAKADLNQNFFKINSPIWWVGESTVAERLPEHIERKIIPNKGELFLSTLLKQCAANNYNSVLVEAGHRLASEFIRANLVDELVIYMAPKLMGSRAQPLLHLPFDSMDQAVHLDLIDVRTIGNDLRFRYRLEQ